MDKNMVIEIVASVITIGGFVTVGYVGFKLLVGLLRMIGASDSSKTKDVKASAEDNGRMASEFAQRQMQQDMDRLNEDMRRNDEELRRHMDEHHHHNHMNDHHHHF